MLNLTDSQPRSFEETIRDQNLRKIILIGTLYTILEIVGLTLSTLGFFESDIRLYVSVIVGFHLIYLPTVYYLSRKTKNRNRKILKALEHTYYTVILIWASLFTTLINIGNEDITTFIAVIVIIAALFVVNPKVSRLLYIINCIFFIGLIYLKIDNILLANAIAFKALIVTAITIFISIENYSIRKKLFISQSELIDVNKILKEQTHRDSLTQLYNNRFIFDYLDKTIEKMVNQGGEMSVLMIDIDNFKQINDRFGHLIGDKVLREVSTTLVNLTRKRDIVVRYGGEEFAVVLMDTNIDEATDVAEKIRLEMMSLSLDGNVEITVSIGVVEWSEHETTELVKAADDMLYEAKRTGKNKVVA